jgi:hypothetical protein
MKKILFWAVLCAAAGQVSKATAGSGDGRTPGWGGFDAARGELRVAMTDFRPASFSAAFPSDSASAAPSRKKPGLAVLFSVAVPGAGQAYAGSWIKAAAFLAVDVAAWVGYAHFQNKGHDWEDQFHAYADARWSKERWESLYDPEHDPSTHGLPDTKTQQYYEMIGKYDQFMKGWDDWQAGGPDLTPHRDFYETMRDNSNKEFINAARCAWITIGGRVVSAFDAAWTIHRKNASLTVRPSAETQWVRSEPVPAFGLKMEW